ncbi:histidine--tRNA ligase [Microlunatus panaciterrae]|uniref:Histidine--tRNA ligase n=1 Tax=Microlunatus panaciterrae TaxID=400768 RepID=A0ABS2RE50_9ACTN|nr:histidine--tRNA ligase [Microlunatus panaciterrae]MBM7797279.1 histidyl-tRNA synthetase [Microlunatus panaciterrae]
MSRPKPLSGFPEFLPGPRMVEQFVLDRLRETFELHGFASIETRAVEPVETLTKGGEIDKEVYTVRRIHADDGVPDELGLHYDLTVPFARYVLENAGQLQFPFRRYQIQKVWRGERPQEGRYREFTQADIDIVGSGELAAHHDVEIPLVALDAMERLHTDLGLPPVLMRVNNRRLAQGFYTGLEIGDTAAVLRIVDKLDKVGPDRVSELLVSEASLTEAQAKSCVSLATISSADETFVDEVRRLGVHTDELEAGMEQLAELVRTAGRYAPGRLVADLKIARGLDYYTGTVYETELQGYESLGSVASGGRYDALASDGRTTYPGVGFSVGVTRILAPLLGKQRLTVTRPVPTCVLVAVDAEETRAAAVAVASQLRQRGIPTEVAPKADKFGKQIRYADRRSIPYVWFGAGANDEVKDIRSGDQVGADPASWQPPSEDLRPRVVENWDE